MSARPSHTGLYGGALVDLLNPDWRAIDLHALALSLARQPRFLGHTDRPISIIEHSLAVASMVQDRYRLGAILHDAREGLMGDFTRPAQVALEALSPSPGAVAVAIERLGSRLDQAIALQALTLSPFYAGENAGGLNHHASAIMLAGEMVSEPVRAADSAACELEIRAFTGWRGDAPRPANVREFYNRLPPDPSALCRAWLDCLEDLVVARFGGNRREGGRARSAWLWGA